MATTKEYIDRAVQTVHETPVSPYYDPAIMLAATGVTPTRHSSSDTSKSPVSFSPAPLHHNRHAYTQSTQPRSPTIFIDSLNRVDSQRKQPALDVRRPTLTADRRRVVSMPENEARNLSSRKDDPGVRVVSMPDKIKSHFRSSTESSASGPSEYYSGQSWRVRPHRPSVDTPETPSPPTSPELYHVRGWDEQFSQALLHSSGTLESHFEEVEDWVTWANSPPRPIPALHGPLSLPYARCPSGAEGTIIERPDNVSRVIWGLGSHDQPFVPSPDVPPCMKSKRTALPKHYQSQQPLLTRKGQGKAGMSEICPELESLDKDYVSQVPDQLSYDEVSFGRTNCSYYHDDDSKILPPMERLSLELRSALLDRASNGSTADTEQYLRCPGGLQPVVHSTSTGFLQPFSSSAVDSQVDNPVRPLVRHPAVEIDQKYHQQFVQQSRRNHGFQGQDILPTPPDSSSPLWSSHFSPYYGQSFSSDTDFSLRMSNNAKRMHGSLYSYESFSPLPENKNDKQVTDMWRNSEPSNALERYFRHMQPEQSIVPPLLSTTSNGARRGVHNLADAQHTTMPMPPPELPQSWARNFLNTNAMLVPSIVSLTQRHLWSVSEEDKAGGMESSLLKPVQDRPIHVPSHEQVKFSGKSFSLVDTLSANRPMARSPEEDKSVALTPVHRHGNTLPKVRLPSLKKQGNATQHCVGNEQQSQIRFGDSRKHRPKFKEKPHTRGPVG